MKDEPRLACPIKLQNGLVFSLFFLLYVFMYGSVLVVDYGYVDDYPHLWAQGHYGFERLMLEGRHLTSLAHWIFFSNVEDIEDLRYARFFAIVGTSLLGWSIYYMLVRTGRNAFQSFCVGVIVCSSLPIQLYVVWSSWFTFPFSAALSAVAVYLCNCAFSTVRFGLKCLLLICSLVALLSAVLIYQPTAMYFWVFAAMTLLVPEASIRDTIRQFTKYLSFFSIAMLLGIAAYQTSSILIPDYPPEYYRGGFVSNIFDKVSWFLYRPLPTSLNPVVAWNWDRRDSMIVNGYVFGGFIAVGLFLYFKGSMRTRIYKLGVAFAVLIFSFTPILLIDESSYKSRTLAASSAIVLLYAFFAFLGYTGRLRVLSRHVNIITACVAIGCAMIAAYQTLAYMVIPQARELTIMQSQLAGTNLTSKDSLHIITPDWGYSLSPLLMKEHGAPTAYHAYAVETMAKFVLQDMTSTRGNLPAITAGTISNPIPPDSVVVDLRKIYETAKKSNW